MSAPEWIGGFRVERELGRGGMGVVYKAHDPRLGRVVALKVILGAATPEERLRFRNEAEAAARLDHEHLVRVYGAGEEQGHPFLALEFVEGEGLDERLRRGPLDPDEAVELLVQVARAVQHAHERGVLHRDLKPANVLVSQGRARLTDFGLARLGARNLTQTGVVLGTPAFMAPEQAGGEAARIGPAADVYGLGATLYSLLAGGPPFRGESLVNVLHAVMTKEPPPLAGVDPALAAIVARALAKEPADRWPSAGALADALALWRADGQGPAPSRGVPAWLALPAALLIAGLGWGFGRHSAPALPSMPPGDNESSASSPIAAVTAPSASPTASGAPFDARLEEIVRQARSGEAREAIRALEAWLPRIEGERERARAQAALALARARWGLWNEALAAKEAAEGLAEDDWLTLRLLGQLEFDRARVLKAPGAKAAARALYQRAILAGDPNPDAHAYVAALSTGLDRASAEALAREHPSPVATALLAQQFSLPAGDQPPDWARVRKLTSDIESLEDLYPRERVGVLNLLQRFLQRATEEARARPGFSAWVEAEYQPVLRRVDALAARVLRDAPHDPVVVANTSHGLVTIGDQLGSFSLRADLAEERDWPQAARERYAVAKQACLVYLGRQPETFEVRRQLVECRARLEGTAAGLSALGELERDIPPRADLLLLRARYEQARFHETRDPERLRAALAAAARAKDLAPEDAGVTQRYAQLREMAAQLGIGQR